MSDEAHSVRRQWMTLMGFSREEIECSLCEWPLDLSEEIDNLNCAKRLKKETPPPEVLQSWCVKR